MELLKQLFCIHSKSGKEGKIRKFIWNWVRQTVPDAKIECDKPGNLYVTKGKSDTYPCIVAHMDQVQERHSKDFIAYEAEDIIIGFSPKHKEQQGLGADDKCGLWIGLKCLQKFDCLKLAFFVGEEVGCKGSGLANMAFFDDCRFVIEPDRKGSEDLITQIGWTPLCSDDFLKDIGFKKFGYKETEGMMTDIEALKDHGLMLSCINVSCGYYKPHSNEEFVYKPRPVPRSIRILIIPHTTRNRITMVTSTMTTIARYMICFPTTQACLLVTSKPCSRIGTATKSIR